MSRAIDDVACGYAMTHMNEACHIWISHVTCG